ncbi:acetyl-coenzyme A synthetase 2-like, mitochondrial isoform X6 [Sceloporus undulatus]|uniref:acetyl-coenzyme A synthetase 2-like, mitochondrial isoform X6 n=1 Tax=Sceloporus undulatus TaxID=8520 RepID=UPI001C4C6193|nr:acetyl-coenzyme A synthetase 2-like, mitochondrial isoform X6 [Sceloporus undulatus]
MAWLLVRTCFHKIAPGGKFSFKTRGWSKGPLTAYMPEATTFPGPVDHQGLYQVSVEQTDTFWGALARSRLMWINPFHSVSNCNLQEGQVSWFLGGQLNVAVNCLDRHVHQAPNKVALIWEKDEPGQEERITYRELLEMTCRLGNTLKRQGVKKGDRVVIYMPPCPMAVASMLACARIGAIHTVVFAGFSSVALADRIQDANSETVITVNQGVRGGKVVELKQTVDQAIKMCPMVKRVFIWKRTDAKVPMSALDIPLEEEMMKEDATCEPVALESEDFLFLLYTSGSTGKPKGLVHSQAGYLLYAAVTHKYVFDYHDGDVFGCVADIGWITGHSYVVYGPLCNGGTTVLFESTPLYPNPGRYWETVERLKINQFYGAPTAIRLLLSYGDNWVKKYDRSSLKILGSVGEPINTEAWEWFFSVVGNGRCPVVDTWWQTGYFFTGDGAYRTSKGYYQLTGRLDDVINVSGHRLGTAEIEDVVACFVFQNKHEAVAESAVIGYPHKIKGEGAYAFVVLKEGAGLSQESLASELRGLVSKVIAKYAAPEYIQVARRLPKTRSGKIMRRVLKKIVENKTDELGDLTTLDDQEAVTEIIEGHRQLLQKEQGR